MNTQFFTFNFGNPVGETFISTAAADGNSIPDASRPPTKFEEEFSTLLESSAGLSSPEPISADAFVVAGASSVQETDGGEKLETVKNDFSTASFDANSPDAVLPLEIKETPAEIPVKEVAATTTISAAVFENFKPAERIFSPAGQSAAAEVSKDEVDEVSVSFVKDAPAPGNEQISFADSEIKASGKIVEHGEPKPNVLKTRNDSASEAKISSSAENVSLTSAASPLFTNEGKSRFEDEKLFWQTLAAEIKTTENPANEIPVSSPLGFVNPPVAQPQQQPSSATPIKKAEIIELDFSENTFTAEPVETVSPVEIKVTSTEETRKSPAVENVRASEKTFPPEQFDRLSSSSTSPPPPAAVSEESEVLFAQPELDARNNSATKEDLPLSMPDVVRNLFADLKISVSGGESQTTAAAAESIMSENKAVVADESADRETIVTHPEIPALPTEAAAPRGWGFESGKLFLQKVAAKIKAKVETSNNVSVFPPTPNIENSFVPAGSTQKPDQNLKPTENNFPAISLNAIGSPVAAPDAIVAADNPISEAPDAPPLEAIAFTQPENVRATAFFNNFDQNENVSISERNSEIPAAQPPAASGEIATSSLESASSQTGSDVRIKTETTIKAPAPVNADQMFSAPNASNGSRQNLFADLKIRLDDEDRQRSAVLENKIEPTGDAVSGAETIRRTETSLSIGGVNESMRNARFADEKMFLQNIAAKIKASDEMPDDISASLSVDSGNAGIALNLSEATADGKAEIPRFSEILNGQIESPMIELASKAAAENQPRVVRLRLRPEDLGVIEIRIESRANGELHAQFKAENPAAGQMLSENIEQLQKTLENAGWKVERLEVTTGYTDSAFFGESANDHRDKREQTEFFGSAHNNHLSTAADENGIEAAAIRPDKIVSVRA